MASTAIVAGTARMTPMDTKSGVVTAMPNVIEALNARVNREPKEIIVHTVAVVMVGAVGRMGCNDWLPEGRLNAACRHSDDWNDASDDVDRAETGQKDAHLRRRRRGIVALQKYLVQGCSDR